MEKCTQNSAAKKVWKTTMIVQLLHGLTIGFTIFIFAVFFKDRFAEVVSPDVAMRTTAALFALFTVLTTLLEVPTGAIGDIVGRKWSVVLNYIADSVSHVFMFAIPFCDNLPSLIVISILAIVFSALSSTFYSGSFTAWCVDTLRKKAPEFGYEQLLAPAKKAYLLSSLLSGALSIFLYLNGFVLVVFFLGALVSAIAAIYCAKAMDEEQAMTRHTLKEINFVKGMQRMGEVIGVGIKLIHTSRAVFLLILVYASYMSVLYLTGYLWPVYLTSSFPVELQQVYWIGLVIGLQTSSFFGAQGLTTWTKKWRAKGRAKTHNETLRRVLITFCFIAAIPVIFFSVMTRYGLDGFWILVIAIVPVKLAYGVIGPVFETLINNHIPDTRAGERATIMSLASLISALLVTIIALPTGGSSGEKSPIGWAIPAGILLVTTLVGNYLLKKAEKKCPEIMPIRIDEPEGEIIILRKEQGGVEKTEMTVH